MVSPTIGQETLAPRRTENRGKQRAENEKINNSKLLSLLQEIRDGIKGRDEQLREEVRWRDNHQDEENKKIENNLTVAL